MFWTQLTEADRQAIISAGGERTYAAGSVLFLENDEPTHAMVILAGRVKLSRASHDGREMIIELRGPGNLVGELGPFDEQPRNATVTAIDDLRVINIAAPRFRRLLLERGSIAVAILSAVSKKLRQATDRRLVATSDSFCRVCSRLLELADSSTSNADNTVEIQSPFTQQELAEWIGISRDAVVMAFQQLRSDGVLATGRRTIRILDVERLRVIVEQNC